VEKLSSGHSFIHPSIRPSDCFTSIDTPTAVHFFGMSFHSNLAHAQLRRFPVSGAHAPYSVDHAVTAWSIGRATDQPIRLLPGNSAGRMQQSEYDDKMQLLAWRSDNSSFDRLTEARPIVFPSTVVRLHDNRAEVQIQKTTPTLRDGRTDGRAGRLHVQSIFRSINASQV